MQKNLHFMLDEKNSKEKQNGNFFLQMLYIILLFSAEENFTTVKLLCE